MNLTDFIKRLKHSFSTRQDLPEFSEEVLLRFLHLLENVREQELSCTDMYAHLDEFVETEIRGTQDAEKITPLLYEHLELCSECCEEYEALLAVLENYQDD